MTMSAPRSFRPEVMADAGFPTISYDDLEVGTEFRSDDRLVRPQDVDAYAFMVDDYDELYFEPGPFGGPVAHPTLLANQALFLRGVGTINFAIAAQPSVAFVLDGVEPAREPLARGDDALVEVS